MMKDANGTPLEVGDFVYTVAEFWRTGTTGQLYRRQVRGFGKKQVLLEEHAPRYPQACIKVPPEPEVCDQCDSPREISSSWECHQCDWSH